MKQDFLLLKQQKQVTETKVSIEITSSKATDYRAGTHIDLERH